MIRALPPGDIDGLNLGCPTGKRILGGGGGALNPNLVLHQSMPTVFPSGAVWVVGVKNITNAEVPSTNVTAYVICANVASSP